MLYFQVCEYGYGNMQTKAAASVSKEMEAAAFGFEEREVVIVVDEAETMSSEEAK